MGVREAGEVCIELEQVANGELGQRQCDRVGRI